MTPKILRKRKLIKPGLQLRLTVVFLCIACAGVSVQAIVLNSSMHSLLNEVEAGKASLLGEWPSLMAFNMVLAFALLVPMTLVVGIWATFKITGPIYRIESHCKAILRGEDPGDCRLRRSDELHDFCDLINTTVNYLRANPRPEAQPQVEEDEALAA